MEEQKIKEKFDVALETMLWESIMAGRKEPFFRLETFIRKGKAFLVFRTGRMGCRKSVTVGEINAVLPFIYAHRHQLCERAYEDLSRIMDAGTSAGWIEEKVINTLFNGVLGDENAQIYFLAVINACKSVRGDAMVFPQNTACFEKMFVEEQPIFVKWRLLELDFVFKDISDLRTKLEVSIPQLVIPSAFSFYVTNSWGPYILGNFVKTSYHIYCDITQSHEGFFFSARAIAGFPRKRKQGEDKNIFGWFDEFENKKYL